MPAKVFITPPAIGERSIVMSVCVCVCVSVCLSVSLSVRDHISGTTRPIFTNFLRVLPSRGSFLRTKTWSHCYRRIVVCVCVCLSCARSRWCRLGCGRGWGPRNRALGGGWKPLPGKGASWGTPLRCGLSSEFFDHLAPHSAAAAAGLRALQWRSRDFSMAL